MDEQTLHPVFGHLRWEPEYSWWFSQIRLPSEEWLDVIVEPAEEDPIAFIQRAADLYRRALDAAPRILQGAIETKLLRLFNETWRRSDETALTASEFMNRLDLTLIHLDPVIPVTLNYEAGDLFGGHGIALELDDELRITGIDLRG